MRVLGIGVMVVGLVPLVAACGGHDKKGPDEPRDRRTGRPEEIDPNPCGGAVDAETYDELNRIFNNKRPSVARCYSDAVAEGKLDKKAKGRITVELVVTAEGKAEGLRAAQDTLKSPDVKDCVFEQIQSWDLPVPNDNCEFSFSYDFEPE